VGERKVGVEVAKLAAKRAILIVADFNDAVFDAERISEVIAEGMSGNFNGPALQRFAVKERGPWSIRFGCAAARKRGDEEGERCEIF
jgi:hypothetical protein